MIAGVGVLVLLSGCASLSSRTAEQVQADKLTATRVYDAIKANPLYFYPAVEVSVNRGVVYLTGLSSSSAGLDEATAIARRVPGVKAVANAMELSSGHI